MIEIIKLILEKYGKDKTRIIDIMRDIQVYYTFVPEQSLNYLSTQLSVSLPELKDTLTYYHFLHDKPAGTYKVYLDTSAIAEISGLKEIQKAFEKSMRCKMGMVSKDGTFGLYKTSCIGMSDQAPAALINGHPVGRLTPQKVFKIIKDLRRGIHPKYKVSHNIFVKTPLILSDYKRGDSVRRIKHLTPEQVREEVGLSGLRGRGGAGFATGKKWMLCAGQKEKIKFVVCNADEGEPGTFKDRMMLSHYAGLVLEGMILGSYAIGAQKGFIYLRAEYQYLYNHLNSELEILRKENLLGKDILGIEEFDFDIEIRLGAGAYVVGEETALLESLEGRRGEPRVRPPFPVEQGYLGKPTIVNNVETFAAVARIIEKGGEWYRGYGTSESPGTKLLSVSGDCKKPGIYEVEWGLSIGDFLDMVEARSPLALQVGGPSGVCLDARQRHRTISFEDLPTGGSMMVFSKQRNLLEIIKNFVQFFVNESCGCCLPCRAGNIVMEEQMNYILSGHAAMIDLDRIKEWSQIISPSSRCGLGQTCTNPLITSMESFPELYKSKVQEHESLYRPFKVNEKTKSYRRMVRDEFC